MSADQYVRQIIGELNVQVCMLQSTIDELKTELADYKDKEKLKATIAKSDNKPQDPVK